jgi:hypothetical protein
MTNAVPQKPAGPFDWTPEEAALCAMVVYGAPQYLAVRAVCLFLARMGDGAVHARRDGSPCLCTQCWSVQ